jgi:hypothetical protein
MMVISCSSQKVEEKDRITIDYGTYNAKVDLGNVDEDVKAYSMTSQIGFTFEEDQTFIYSVRAMGKAIDDVGKWEIRGDSMYIFDLEKGPDSAFKLEKINESEYRIVGPNRFILSKTDKITPIKD